MSESEPTLSATPTPAQSSLLRRLFRPRDVGFYLMIALAWIGAIYTTYSVESSRWYWQWLIPAFGLICIATQWNNVEPTLKARLNHGRASNPALGRGAVDGAIDLYGVWPG
jgi:hypothetical protein